MVKWEEGETLDDLKLSVTLQALHHFEWNRTEASKALGISIRTVRNLIWRLRKRGYHVPHHGRPSTKPPDWFFEQKRDDRIWPKE